MSDNRSVHARFHAPEAERAGDVVDLPLEEAQHLVRVLRLTAGAAVRVFNGRGGEFDAVVDTATKARVQVRVHGRRDAQPEAHVALTLAQAVLKGDKMDEVVRDAVMMGVLAIRPMVTTRSEALLASLRRSHRQERWQRISVSSAKQCGRAVVPVVHEPCTFEAALEPLGGTGFPHGGLMLVEPSAAGSVVSVGEVGDKPSGATVLIGPEGGWTADEITRGARVCRLVTLGSRTLRADAMALVAVTALLTHWCEL
jgi:16S rRNA (uracil1498-N3)-methyltransferase